MEANLANADVSNDFERPLERFASNDAEGSEPRTRRRIPPPPHRVDEDAVNATLGVGSRALLALTLFFYVVSLALTTSRAYFGDTAPAPTPDDEATTRLTRSPPPPASIAGTPAGDAWTEGIETFGRRRE